MTTASENQSANAQKKLTPDQKLESILRDFETNNPSKNYDGYSPGTGLREIIERSPALKKNLLEAVDKGDITKIEALSDGKGAAATYNNITKTVTVNANHLTYTDRLAYMTMVVGHEVGHALDKNHHNKTGEFEAGIARLASDQKGPHDYTELLKNQIESQRRSEGLATIEGFNAVSSRVRKDNPSATIDDIQKALPESVTTYLLDRKGSAPNFRYELKEGLDIGPDLQIKTTEKNIESASKHYYDLPVGEKVFFTSQDGSVKQDYRNHNASTYMDVIQAAEDDYAKLNPGAKRQEITVDIKALGLDPAQIQTTLNYTDSSSRQLTVPKDKNGEVKANAPASLTGDSAKTAEQAHGSIQLPSEIQKLAQSMTQSGKYEAYDQAQIGSIAAVAFNSAGGKFAPTDVVQVANGQFVAVGGDPQNPASPRTDPIDPKAAAATPVLQSLAQLNQAQEAQIVAQKNDVESPAYKLRSA
jgi:hypothetical protein